MGVKYNELGIRVSQEENHNLDATVGVHHEDIPRAIDLGIPEDTSRPFTHSPIHPFTFFTL